jgi:putative hydrolase of the HAD superfamily
MNVVFDLGAVLIGWEPATLLRMHFPERASTAEAAGALARAFFHHDDWLAFDCGIRTIDDVVARTSERLSLPRERLARMLTTLGDELQPIAESVEVLEKLHGRKAEQSGLRLFYLSNMPSPYARALERRMAFFGLFDGGIFSGDVKLIKPNSDIYQLLAWRHGLRAEQTLFIDDTAANVEAARALGWHAIHCTSPKTLGRQIGRYLSPLDTAI